MTSDKCNEKIKCDKCNELFCFRVYRYRHFKICNGNSYGDIFNRPNQPIRKYKDKNNEEEEQNDSILN